MRKRQRRTKVHRECDHCGGPMVTDNYQIARGRGRCCSKNCALANARKVSLGPNGRRFLRPESSKAERVRANGLVNMRIRRGALTRPDACQACLKRCKPDSHHPDYAQPGFVWWLCRSCHMRLHFGTLDAELLERARAAT